MKRRCFYSHIEVQILSCTAEAISWQSVKFPVCLIAFKTSSVNTKQCFSFSQSSQIKIKLIVQAFFFKNWLNEISYNHLLYIHISYLESLDLIRKHCSFHPDFFLSCDFSKESMCLMSDRHEFVFSLHRSQSKIQSVFVHSQPPTSLKWRWSSRTISWADRCRVWNKPPIHIMTTFTAAQNWHELSEFCFGIRFSVHI